MFAVIKTGGKQYRVAADDLITVDRLEAAEGDRVVLDSVLMVGDEETIVGAPFVEGASVSARVDKQARGDRILVFKKRRRKHSQRSRGHRQDLTVLRVEEILTNGAKPKKSAEKAPAKAEKAPVKKADAPKPEGKEAASEKKTSAKAPALTDLKGVGPAAAKKLEDAGLTIALIAKWSAEDLQRFDEELGLKGKAEKDDWIGQAKALLG